LFTLFREAHTYKQCIRRGEWWQIEKDISFGRSMMQPCDKSQIYIYLHSCISKIALSYVNIDDHFSIEIFFCHHFRFCIKYFPQLSCLNVELVELGIAALQSQSWKTCFVYLTTTCLMFVIHVKQGFASQTVFLPILFY